MALLADAPYLVGSSGHERARLMRQASLLDPFTRRLLREAGPAPGMRVLDVGCGVADVTLLGADLVGPAGFVLGVDRDASALGTARARAAAAHRRNVAFVDADFQSLAVETMFDAVVGRYVLVHQPDPAAALRSLLPHLRPGGVVFFHEPDFSDLRATPSSPLYGQMVDWFRRTAARIGFELAMGRALPAAYVAAGLPAPELRLETPAGGGPAFDGYAYLADATRSILPAIERVGVATAAEVAIDTLADRLRGEVTEGGGWITLPTNVGVWSRVG